MPLTPQDVQNKLFTKKVRGYDMEEVDGFLDEVEAELGRLLRENNGLRNDGSGPAVPVLQKQSATEPAVPAVAAVAPASGGDSAEMQQAALRVLGMAEQTLSSARLEAAEQLGTARTEAAAMLDAARTEANATLLDARTEAERLRSSASDELDQTLAPARAEATQLVASARAEADETIVPARAEAERLVAAARQEADATLTPARAEAQKVLDAARAEAERLSAQSLAAKEHADAEISAKVAGANQGLETRRTALESHIEDLRSFEREYRSRLKAYLVGQLGDLDGKVVPEDGGAGVPTPGRTGSGTSGSGTSGSGTSGSGTSGSDTSGSDTSGVASGDDLDLSDGAPGTEPDAGREVPLGQRSAAAPQDGAPGVGPFRSGSDQTTS